MCLALRKIPYKSDIVTLAIILVLSVVEWVHINIWIYRGALQNLFLPGIMLVLLYEPCKILVVLFAIMRRCRSLTPRRERKRRMTTASLAVLFFVGSWVLPMIFLPPVAVFLKGYEEWVCRNVDIDAIQTWLLSKEAHGYFGQTYSIGSLDPLPGLVTDFDPKHIAFHGDEHGKGRCVVFEWGGALARWGFVVGLPTMKTKLKGRIQSDKSCVEHRRPLKPGIYVFLAG